MSVRDYKYFPKSRPVGTDSDGLVDDLAERMDLDHCSCKFSPLVCQIAENMSRPRGHPWPHLSNRNGIFDYLAPETVPGEVDGGLSQGDLRVLDAIVYLSLRFDAHSLAEGDRLDRLDGNALRINRKPSGIVLPKVFAIG